MSNEIAGDLKRQISEAENTICDLSCRKKDCKERLADLHKALELIKSKPELRHGDVIHDGISTVIIFKTDDQVLWVYKVGCKWEASEADSDQRIKDVGYKFTGINAFPVFAEAALVGRLMTCAVIALGPSFIYDLVDKTPALPSPHPTGGPAANVPQPSAPPPPCRASRAVLPPRPRPHPAPPAMGGERKGGELTP